MALRDLTSQRLHVTAALSAGARVACSDEQANYLRTVLRMADGSSLLVFNGRDGEWRASLAHAGKRGAALDIVALERPQEQGPDVHYLFAPLKRARLDYMVQKATEMGVARLIPVMTQHTVPERINLDRLRANVIEAAEQCGVLRVPEVEEPRALAEVLAAWPAGRRLVFCDERAPLGDPLQALREAFPHGPAPAAVLVGPEGGFSAAEHARLSAATFATAISLGPRIMRADTAAIAALALLNAVAGDWRQPA